MNRINREAGMTIVELLIALVITAAVSTIILNFSVDSMRTSVIQTAQDDLLSDARIGLDKVANDIRTSTIADTNNRWLDEYAPAAPSNKLSWASNASTLVLASSALGTNKNVIFDDALNYITVKNNLIYFVKNNTLYRRTLAATVSGNAAKTTCPKANATALCPADAIIMRNVSQFTVSYIDVNGAAVAPSEARAVELNITLTDDIFGSPVSSSYKTRMVFRNG